MEAIGKHLPATGATPAEERQTPREWLVPLPSTAELQAKVESYQTKIAEFKAEADKTGFTNLNVIRPVERDLLRAEENLAWGHERDAIQATRPEGCWCLGEGGKGKRYLTSEIHGFETYCPCCDGQAVRERASQERARQVQEANRRRLGKLFDGARIPKRFAAVTLDTFPATEATRESVERLKLWVSGPEDEDDHAGWDQWQERRQSLFLYGPFGTGKTGLAVGLLKRFMGESLDVGLFITVPSLLDRIRRTYSDDAEATEHEVLDLVKSVPFLVLDDLGAERVTDWVAERLFVIINHRHDEDLQTVFTSNLTPEQLGNHIGERTTWRVIEMSEVVSLDGPNLRDRLP